MSQAELSWDLGMMVLRAIKKKVKKTVSQKTEGEVFKWDVLKGQECTNVPTEPAQEIDGKKKKCVQRPEGLLWLLCTRVPATLLTNLQV